MTNKLTLEAKVNLDQSLDEAAGSTPSGKIEAVATTFGKREGMDGRKFYYKPEGFQEWAKELNSGSKPLPMFFQHEDMEMPVGEWTSVEMDENQMILKGRLYLNTTRGKDLYTIMQESPNLINSVSVGAYADEAQMVNEAGEADEKGDYFQITKGGLAELSIVMNPNNPNARVSKLEYYFEDGKPNLKVIEKQLREEVGLSRADATAAARIFREALVQRDVAPVASEETPVEQRDVEAAVTTPTPTIEEELLAALELRQLEQALGAKLKSFKENK